MASSRPAKARHYERALDIAIAVNTARDVNSIARVVMQRVAELIPHDRSSFALLDEANESLQIRDITLSPAAAREGDERGKRVEVSANNVLGWVAINRQPHLRKDLDEHDRYKPVQSGRQVPAHIVVPILGRLRCYGVMTIGSYQANAFDEADQRVFANYASLTGIAIENLKLYQAAQRLAVCDGLTGAYNHRHFIECVDAELQRAKHYGEAFSICFIDIDHFKKLNDSFGHQVGDQVLRQTAQLLQRGTRAADRVFRYGGEEFVVLLPATSPSDASRAASSLMRLLRTENVCQPPAGSRRHVTVSMGVATAPVDANTREQLIRCADRAMYLAKRGGRDQVVIYGQLNEARQSRTRQHHSMADHIIDSLLPPDRKSTQQPRHGCSRGHVEQVVALAEMLAVDVGLNAHALINLRIAAELHDIGEQIVPAHILDKTGPLTPEERQLIEKHPAAGADYLREAIRVPDIIDAVRHHHERFDGNGYPDGARGKNIPLGARILAIAEVFDALVSRRPYRSPISDEQAYEVLRDAAHSQLDPDLVLRFITCHKLLREH